MGRMLNIRPTTSVYSTYKNIKYDPWTAIAEFVDNSTQSYYDNKSKLEATKYWKGLNVEICYQKDEKGEEFLEIRDNAFGMDYGDFQRAIVLDSPPSRATRSEFGMGLKTAACWFGTKWSVITTELGSDVVYSTTIDVEALRKYKNEEIEVQEEHCNPKEHYTIVRIWNLNRKLSGRQIGKTKDKLRGMYRVDLRSSNIKIFYNGETLTYKDPHILEELLPDGCIKKWKKEINFALNHEGGIYKVNGFIAIREEGSTSGAGLTLIRRGRVIVGGYEDTYRPEEVFEKTNSFVYQRLFGELIMDDWPVTQTKDAFDWYGGLEDLLIDELVVQCSEYVKKAKEYRVRENSCAGPGVQDLVDTLSGAGVIDDVETSVITSRVITTNDSSTQHQDDTIPGTTGHDYAEEKGNRISFAFGEQKYVFDYIHVQDNPYSNWLNISQESEEEYIVEWNVKHPFFINISDHPEFNKAIQIFTFALALSEIEARRIGTDGKIDPSLIRMKMNETLKSVIKEKI